MFKTLVVILFSFVLSTTILPSGALLSAKLNAVEVLHDEEKKENSSPESEDIDGEEKEDVQEKQLFFDIQSSEILFNASAIQVAVNYIERNYSLVLKIQLPPPKLQA